MYWQKSDPESDARSRRGNCWRWLLDDAHVRTAAGLEPAAPRILRLVNSSQPEGSRSDRRSAPTPTRAPPNACQVLVRAEHFFPAFFPGLRIAVSCPGTSRYVALGWQSPADTLTSWFVRHHTTGVGEINKSNAENCTLFGVGTRRFLPSGRVSAPPVRMKHRFGMQKGGVFSVARRAHKTPLPASVPGRLVLSRD